MSVNGRSPAEAVHSHRGRSADSTQWSTPARLPEVPEQSSFGAWIVNRTITLATVVLVATLVSGCAIILFARIMVSVTADGRLEPANLLEVRATETGSISDVLVTPGDRVQKGELLALLGLPSVSAEVRRLEFQRAATRAQISRAQQAHFIRSDLQRQRIARAEAGVIAARARLQQTLVTHRPGMGIDSVLRSHVPGQHVALDLAIADIKSALAELRLSESEVSLLDFESETSQLIAEFAQIEADLGDLHEQTARMRIVAPVDGLLLTEGVERLVGSYVQVGDPLFQIARGDRWHAVVALNEADVHKVSVGDSALVEVRVFGSSGDSRLAGTVVHVASEAERTTRLDSTGADGSRYKVVVALTGAPSRSLGISELRRDYSARVTIFQGSERVARLIWKSLGGGGM